MVVNGSIFVRCEPELSEDDVENDRMRHVHEALATIDDLHRPFEYCQSPISIHSSSQRISLLLVTDGEVRLIQIVLE
jgi:hypothetical protein